MLNHLLLPLPALPRPPGNLLAPYVAACTSDLLFSGYQRVRQAQVEEQQRSTMERLSTLTSSLASLRQAKLERLQPSDKPSTGSGKARGGESDSSSAGGEAEQEPPADKGQ